MEKHLNILVPFLPIRFKNRIRKVAATDREDISPGKAQDRKEAARQLAREALKREMTEFILQCMTVLEHEKERGVFSENARKDIGEFLWKACGYLLEEDAALYGEVSAEVEPAVKLSREIIQELQDDIKELRDNNKELRDNNKELRDNNKELRDNNKELRDNNKELQNNNKELQNNNRELHQEKENACRWLIEKAKAEEKSEKEAMKELMMIFALSEEAAKEKVRAYWC